MSASTTRYKTLTQAWPNPGEAVRILVPGEPGELGAVIATIPLTFLRTSNANSWDFVLYTIKLCIEEDGYILSEDGQRPDGRSVPAAGTYAFHTVSGKVTFRPGPEGKSRLRPPTGTTISTMSNSGRSTANQSTFRTRLIARDFNCLVTGAEYDECIAAHILPYSRTDVWESFGISYPFTASCGLLLASTYHQTFDKYRWSLYNPGDGTLVVHFFSPTTTQHYQHHGKVLPYARFRINNENELPDPRFLAWHYQQCVLTNVRGFHVKP